ncbi:MAG: bifunctional (p)ppGpp synthetase/guanosine-3',5'-bis(diphosphate) 3'-pyrophosphohydrolase [Candidatus Gracilibacteria bacterium]|nr:bifunctional (p)ppGpp synthetase/guanosine-3',5'-bis(diphosphate) 3'-pyrophosphohydrolase [Candidatus Gracilibacteria bacterium]
MEGAQGSVYESSKNILRTPNDPFESFVNIPLQDFFPVKNISLENINQNIDVLHTVYNKIKVDIDRFYNNLIKVYPQGFTPEEEKHIRHAYFLAAISHKDQHRDDGSLYLEHPIRVALISLKFPLRPNESAADRVIQSLCHDVIEDTKINIQSLAEIIGDKNALGVKLLSKEKEHHYISKIKPKNHPNVSYADQIELSHSRNQYNDYMIDLNSELLPAEEISYRLLQAEKIYLDLLESNTRIRNAAREQRDIWYYKHIGKSPTNKYSDRIDCFATMDCWEDERIIRKIRETVTYLLPTALQVNRIAYFTLISQINSLIQKRNLPISPLASSIDITAHEVIEMRDILRYLPQLTNKKHVTKSIEDNGVVLTILEQNIHEIQDSVQITLCK